MNSSRIFLLLFTFFLTSNLFGQSACVQELTKIYEPQFRDVRIEPDGRLSYIKEKSIFTSEDEGMTWTETVTPFDLKQGTGTDQVTSYKAFANGNYVLFTRHTMTYQINNEWRLFEVNGDSHSRIIPFIIGDKAYVIQDSKLYSYDDNSKVIQFELQLNEYQWPRVEQFKNHFLVFTGTRDIYTNDLNYVTSLSHVEHITEEGYVIRYSESGGYNGVWGSHFTISRDLGETSTTLFEHPDQELHVIGDIDGRLYVRGFISQPEAWSSGHHQAILGYIDLESGEFHSTQDGVTNAWYSNKQVIINEDLYFNNNGAIIKYVGGDLTNRQVLLGNNETPIKINKLRRSNDGILYALTPSFLYKSLDDGKSWNEIMDYYTVTDFDLDSEDNLYLISSDRIMKSSDAGNSFTRLSRIYDEGLIDDPTDIVCLDNDKIIVRGFGHFYQYPFGVDLGCIDCWISYPRLIYQSENDGMNWNYTHVDLDFGGQTFLDIYGLPGDRSFKATYGVENEEQLLFSDNLYISSINKADFSRQALDLPNERIPGQSPPLDYETVYGFALNGDLIKNDLGTVSYSKDFGTSFTEISSINKGRIFGGAVEESIFILSNEEDNVGGLSYIRNYNDDGTALTVKLTDDPNTIVPDHFDNFYTDGTEEFLFSGVNTYRVTNICFPDIILNHEGNLTICTGQSLLLGASINAEQFNWTHDGIPLDANLSSISIDEPGIYSLTAINGSCVSESEEFELFVEDNPPVEFANLEDPNICEGETYTITVASTADEYLWFQNGVLIEGENSEQLTTNAPGEYFVQVYNDGCVSISDVVEVVVNAPPIAMLNVDEQNQICQGDSLFIEVSEADEYEWFINGQSIGNNASILAATQAGNYTVMVTENGCSNLSPEINVEIVEPPVLTTNTALVSNLCLGESTVLEVDGIGDSFVWMHNGEEIGDQAMIEVSAPGTYQVFGFNGSCVSDPITFEVNLFEIAIAELNLQGEQFICEGDSALLMVNDDFENYQWYFNDELIEGDANQVEINEAGSYYVEAFQNGCKTESAATKFQFVNVPEPLIMSDAFQICPGDLTNLFTDLEGDLSYTWFVNGAEIPESNSFSIDTNLPGSYAVEINLNGCTKVSDPIDVSEYEVIPPSIDRINDILNSSLANSYQWYLDGVAIDGATGQGFSVSVSGTYYVIVIDENGCESQSESLEVIISSSENIGQIEGLKVYPNPVLNILTIEYDTHAGELSNIRVFNELGMNVHRMDLNLQGASKTNLNVNHLAAGIYYLEITLDTGFRSIIKFVKTK